MQETKILQKQYVQHVREQCVKQIKMKLSLLASKCQVMILTARYPNKKKSLAALPPAMPPMGEARACTSALDSVRLPNSVGVAKKEAPICA